MALTWVLARGYPLVLLSFLDAGVPFVRMLAMSRLLPLRELGFASGLTATDGMYEQVTTSMSSGSCSQRRARTTMRPWRARTPCQLCAV